MEYFLGSIITLVIFYFAYGNFIKKDKEIEVKELMYSQSYLHEILKPYQPTNSEIKAMKVVTGQSKKYLDKNRIRVLFARDTVYWIADNALMSARLLDGEVDQSTTERVDTMGMDDVELEEVMFIVEKLTEGLQNDNRDSGN